FPAACDDAVAAFRDVAARAGELGIDPARLGVGGDSAGGNLSAVVGLETRGDAVRPSMQLLLYAALDPRPVLPSPAPYGKRYFRTREAGDWYYGHSLGPDRETRLDPRASPLLVKDVAGTPPAIVAIAGFDTLRDEDVAYAARLREARITVAQ